MYKILEFFLNANRIHDCVLSENYYKVYRPLYGALPQGQVPKCRVLNKKRPFYPINICKILVFHGVLDNFALQCCLLFVYFHWEGAS